MQKSEGQIGPFSAASWALWFRHTFNVSQPCLVGLDLGLPGQLLPKAACLVLLNNDTSKVGRFVYTAVAGLVCFGLDTQSYQAF